MKAKVLFFISVTFLLLLGSASVGFAQYTPPPASFASAVPYTAAGSSPVSVAVGDFNGDGILDMVVANNDGTVNVLLGNGDGTFNTTPSYSYDFSGDDETVSLTVVVVGDFNHDGILDFAVLLGNSSQVAVFTGINNGSGKNSTGKFNLYSTTTVGDHPCSAAVGDFNGDGLPDIAVVNCYGDDVMILLNKSSEPGNFSVANDYGLNFSPAAIAAGDFNGDGILDLAVVGVGEAGGVATVLLGNGDGSFTVPETYTPNGDYSPTAVAVGDFNGDGKLDLAVTDDYSYTMDVFLGNGDGTFGTTPWTSSPNTDAYYTSVAVGDFNGDGIQDLAVADSNDDVVDVFLGNGDGTFATPTAAVPAGSEPSWVAVGDFNGDGKPDLVVADNGGGVSVLLNTTSPPITLPLNYAGATNQLFAFDNNVFNYKVTYPPLNSSSAGAVSLSVWPILISQADLNALLHGEFSGAMLVPYAGTAPYGVLYQVTCQDSSGATVACPTATGAITFYASWNSPPRQSITTPAFLMAEIGPVGTQTWSNIFTAYSQTRIDPTVTGRAGPGFSDFVVVDLGAGPQASVSPSSINFGTVYLGTITVKSVKVTNVGTAPMMITDPFISILSGGNSKDFAALNLCPRSLAAGKSCWIFVSFLAGPHYTVPQTATLDVVDNAPGSPQTVALSATVIDPQAWLSPWNLSFGPQKVKTSSAAKVVTLKNTGATPLVITTIAIAGAVPPDFAQTNTCLPPVNPSGTLGAGASCTISVTFKPTAKGLRWGSVVITDNAQNSPQNVTLSGTGQQ